VIDKVYGSLLVRKLKGNITYKLYFEMISDTEFSEKPAYLKLIFPPDIEVIVSPLAELEQAIKSNISLGIKKYEFEEDGRKPKHLYLLSISGKIFDLPEKFAFEFARQGIAIQEVK